ncbi:type II CAAX prenyl endopeptidase Rce1 family protein [Sphingomonas sp. IC081]|uniref:CPBP family glutamic-type intramembrane protease n=1 Tax=Sphingomonas sp. IC081 TaxID=304378 RepID=UPI001157E7EA|nr:CPBP family glutamic-type intramembrane protease [Sphingomonas sp. IC081]QDK34104.1 CPBP family intramembrane metalloprotease [Sphingomonas sp. IC081]
MATRTDPAAASRASTRALALLRELPGFLKRPAILTPVGLRSREGWAALGVMALLHVAVLLLVVLPLIGLWQQAMHLPMPDAFDKLPAGWLLPITVLVAPIAEETLFRGWQTGRPRALWLLLCAVLFAGLAVYAKALAPMVLLGMLVLLTGAALGGWIVLRKRSEPAALYRAAYPVIFWIAALVFAGVHLMNYPAVSVPMLPMVLPQLWAALMLGFTRQRIGLPAAMLQHMGANAATMVLVHLGG